MKQTILTALFVVATMVAFGQKKKTVEIKSSIQCEMCVDRLNNMFTELWSIRAVDYNLDNKTIQVVYNANKITEEEIKQHVSNTGYDANDIVANKEAHDKLPMCCQKGATACEM